MTGAPATPGAPSLRGGQDAGNLKTALITLSAAGAGLLAPLTLCLPGARLFVHESVREGWLRGETVMADDSDRTGMNGGAPGGPEKGGEKALPVARFAAIAELTASLFGSCRELVYAAPCGVVVRAIAPLVKSKYGDPAVVVLDVGGRWAVSLLSGHEGGANDLALRVANLTGADPVITTTTEAAKTVIVGIGCRRGAAAERIVAAVLEALAGAGVSLDEVRLLASADLKADEPGLLDAAGILGVPLRFIAAEEIRGCSREFARSGFVQERVNLPAVAEPAALLAGKRTQLIFRKKTYNGIAIALAREGAARPEPAPVLL